MVENNNIWKLLIFDKGDVFTYLIFGIILIYIWKISSIGSMWLLPFIIFIGFIYFRQDYYHKINVQLEHKMDEIKTNLLNKKYLNLAKNNKMLIFLDSIQIYSKYNPINYTDFLKICDKYFINQDIYTYTHCIEKFEEFIYSLPIQMLKTHYLKKKELVDILKQFLKEPKRKMVEMQSFIPYNLMSTQIYKHGAI